MLMRRFGDLMSSNASFSIGKMKFRWSMVIQMVILLSIVNYHMNMVEGLKSIDDCKRDKDGNEIKDKKKIIACLDDDLQAAKEAHDKKVKEQKEESKDFKKQELARLEFVAKQNREESVLDAAKTGNPMALMFLPLLDQGLAIAKKTLKDDNFSKSSSSSSGFGF